LRGMTPGDERGGRTEVDTDGWGAMPGHARSLVRGDLCSLEKDNFSVVAPGVTGSDHGHRRSGAGLGADRPMQRRVEHRRLPRTADLLQRLRLYACLQPLYDHIGIAAVVGEFLDLAGQVGDRAQAVDLGLPLLGGPEDSLIVPGSRFAGRLQPAAYEIRQL